MNCIHKVVEDNGLVVKFTTIDIITHDVVWLVVFSI